MFTRRRRAEATNLRSSKMRSTKQSLRGFSHLVGVLVCSVLTLVSTTPVGLAVTYIASDAPSGDSSTPLSVGVYLNSNDGVTAIQFDVHPKSSVGSLGAASLGVSQLSDQRVDAAGLSNGAMRLVVSSPTNSALGNGQMVAIPITLTTFVQAGTSAVSIDNIIISRNNGTSVSYLTSQAALSGLTAQNDGPKTLGQTIHFSASVVAGSNPTYAWDFGDGTTATGMVTNHSYAQTGDYTTTLTASNLFGSVKATTVASVLPTPTPTPSPSPTPTPPPTPPPTPTPSPTPTPTPTPSPTPTPTPSPTPTPTPSPTPTPTPTPAPKPVVGWGQNTLVAVPSNIGDVLAIVAGPTHNLALRADGTVVAWGNNDAGQASPPSTLSGVVAVAVGEKHSLALRSDGSVVAWGDNSYGQSAPPATLSGAVAVAAGGQHSLALLSNGTVIGWGRNDKGQAAPPVALADVVSLAAGNAHSLALLADGSVAGWGDNSSGQLSVPAGLTGVSQIAAGGNFSLAVRANGSVAGWGGNESGQLLIPAGLTSVAAVSAGTAHGLALRIDGSVVGWGRNDYGQTQSPTGLSNVAAIAAGGSQSLALIQAGPPRSIALMPASQVLNIGDTGWLFGMGVGTGAVGYQWARDGVDLVGETYPFLVIDDLKATDAGHYALRLTNTAGSTNIGPVVLTVMTPQTPTVSVQAKNPTVVEGVKLVDGFVITRSGGSTTKSLTVDFVLKGTATSGLDYRLFVGKQKLLATSTSVIIPAGATSVTISVKAKPDLIVEGDEKVTMKLTAGPNYLVGTQSKAKITIQNKP